MTNFSRWISLLGFVLLACSCDRLPTGEAGQVSQDSPPLIFPDYRNVTIPSNIAPLNFEVLEEGEGFAVRIKGEHGPDILIKSGGSIFKIPPKRWAAFLKANRACEISLQLFKKEDKQWLGFEPFHIQVAAEDIDPYLVYRLIPPGYETWSSMGLYERDLGSFRERPLIENRYIEENCVNCHAFRNGSSDHMLFHIRGSLGGTMIKQGDEIRKVDLRNEETLSAGVYPSWHPSGRYIAFSTNRIEQYFHAQLDQSIEVLDRQSDLILYHTVSGKITHVPGTDDDRHMETYPSWSPDGKMLYFSRSDAGASTAHDSIEYDIFRMAFDPDRGEFGNSEAVLLASAEGKSASFPRISPDGKYLLCTLHDYGTFPIWHKEADLCLVDLESGTAVLPDQLNSDAADSFHCWAQNNRWIVFSSRRYDGRYTKLYLSYFSKEGKFHKPFLLPQRHPRFYDSFFYSYNRPELITGTLEVNQRTWVKKVRSE